MYILYLYIFILYIYGFQFPPPSHLQFSMQDFDKKLSHVNRGASSTKPVDGAGGAAGLDTMAEANGRMGWKDLEITGGCKCMMTNIYLVPFIMSFISKKHIIM